LCCDAVFDDVDSEFGFDEIVCGCYPELEIDRDVVDPAEEWQQLVASSYLAWKSSPHTSYR
jgi:hypothetical protein